jgi:peptide/nickel transport system substrate-binding protein
LRDATFSSGNPVTAEDVRFSLLRVKNIKGYGAFLADPLKSVEVVDPKTVRVVLNGPNASFLAALAGNVFGILDSKVVRAQGGVDTPGADTIDKAESWFYNNSAGSAPYVLTRYVRESEIVFERNEKYYGSKPYFRQIIIKHVKDPSTQLLLLQRGDVDAALDLNLDQLESLRGKPGIDIHKALSLIIVYAGLNTSVKPWDNPMVREAVKYATDYDGIVNKLTRGAGIQLATPIPVGILGMTMDFNRKLLYRENLAKARQLLNAAGYSNGVAAQLAWEVGANYGTLSTDRLAEKLRSDWGRVGITLKLLPLASSIVLTQYRQGKVPAIIENWYPDFIDPDNFSYFASGFINKRLRWESPKAKDLVTKAVQVSSTAQREMLYRGYYQILAEGPTPYIGLFQPEQRVATRSSIGDFRYNPSYFFEVDRAIRK